MHRPQEVPQNCVSTPGSGILRKVLRVECEDLMHSRDVTLWKKSLDSCDGRGQESRTNE